MTRLCMRRKLYQPISALLGLLLILTLVSTLYKKRGPELPRRKSWSGLPPDRPPDEEKSTPQQDMHVQRFESSKSPLRVLNGPADLGGDAREPHFREIFSHASRSRKFWPISYGDASAGDPLIIPHALDPHSWLLIVRREVDNHAQHLIHSLRLVDGLFSFTDTSQTLLPPDVIANSSPTAATRSYSVRVFCGPEVPYVMHTSWSPDSGFEIWIQDALQALDAFHFRQFTGPHWFSQATRIAGLSGLESSANRHPFMFWDTSGQIYIHETLWPQRIFAPLEFSGDVRGNFAHNTRKQDQMCYGKFLRHVEKSAVNLQQSSNSLSVTLCKRKDPACVPKDDNTFIMHIFNVRHIYNGHSVYEPYVILFQRAAPFSLHAISQRPLWIHGRKYVGGDDEADGRDRRRPQRLNIVSMAWRSHVQKYHGYIDDGIFLGFGLEGSEVGFIDIIASDLLQDLGEC